MKYFCSKCGKTTQYGIELPKFCAFCGQSFANKLTSSNIEDKRNKFLNELKLKKNINPINIEDDILYNSEYSPEEDTINEFKISNLKNIKPSFKLDIYQNKGESFASLIENPSKPINLENNTQSEFKSREQILEEFQKEAGLFRPKE